jgi:hypothetical protein
MRTAKTLALALALVFAPTAAHAQLLIIGLDSKISFDKAGTVIFGPPGKDSVAIVDISSPEAPKIVANLPLMNTIIGLHGERAAGEAPKNVGRRVTEAPKRVTEVTKRVEDTSERAAIR